MSVKLRPVGLTNVPHLGLPSSVSQNAPMSSRVSASREVLPSEVFLSILAEPARIESKAVLQKTTTLSSSVSPILAAPLSGPIVRCEQRQSARIEDG